MNGLKVLVECTFACNTENLRLRFDFGVKKLTRRDVRTFRTLETRKRCHISKITRYAHLTHALDFSWTSFRCSIINLFSLNGFWQTVHLMYSDGSISWCVFSCPSRFPLLLRSFPQIRQINFSRGLKFNNYCVDVSHNESYLLGWMNRPQMISDELLSLWMVATQITEKQIFVRDVRMSEILVLFQVTVVRKRFKALWTEEFLFSVGDRAKGMWPVGTNFDSRFLGSYRFFDYFDHCCFFIIVIKVNLNSFQLFSESLYFYLLRWFFWLDQQIFEVSLSLNAFESYWICKIYIFDTLLAYQRYCAISFEHLTK